MLSPPVTSSDMAQRSKPADEGDNAPKDRGPRVPVKMDDRSRDMLREIAFLWLREPVERLGGEMLAEAVKALHKRGRSAVVADFIEEHPDRAIDSGLLPKPKAPK